MPDAESAWQRAWGTSAPHEVLVAMGRVTLTLTHSLKGEGARLASGNDVHDNAASVRLAGQTPAAPADQTPAAPADQAPAAPYTAVHGQRSDPRQATCEAQHL